jgi:hypothetical protein
MSRDYKVSATGAKSIPSLEAGTWDNTRSNPDMAHSAEGFAPPCVTSDTVVLTDKGWSAVKNICKPPLGVVPQHIWREARARDLARAIHEYCESGARIQRPSVPPATASPSNVYPVGDWIRELGELWETL